MEDMPLLLIAPDSLQALKAFKEKCRIQLLPTFALYLFKAQVVFIVLSGHVNTLKLIDTHSIE